MAGIDYMKLISETKFPDKIVCIYEMKLQNKTWREIRIYKNNINYTQIKKIKF